MPEEQPLGASILLSFQDASTSYPIISVLLDPRRGGYGGPTLLSTGAPAVGSTTGLSPEAIATWPTAGFTRMQVMGDTRVLWIYEILPGPILTTKSRGSAVRGIEVDTEVTHVSVSTSPQTGTGVVESTVTPENAVTASLRTIKTAGGVFPSDELYAFWDFVPLPLLLFSITNVVYCNNTQFFSLVSNPLTSGGSSVLRKHRRTVGYSSSYPNPDLSQSSFVTADVRYQGKVISFSFNNVLNDAISYSEVAATSSGGSSCTWTEAYNFPATTPSATVFAAGAWYVRSFEVEPWGVSGFRWVKTEFYSAAGNPAAGGSPATNATGTLTSDNTNVSNNDTVTIGAYVYTFKTALTSSIAAYEVLIGGSADASLLNLIRAINRTGTPGTDYGSLTAANTQAIAASSVTAHAFAVGAIAPGVSGNSIATTEASTHLSWGSATLTGGA